MAEGPEIDAVVKWFNGQKGFGFVELENDAEAQAAIAALNGKQVDGRALTVNEARPKTEGGRGGGGDHGGGGGEGRGRSRRGGW